MSTVRAIEPSAAGLPGGIDHDLLALYYGELRRIARAAMRGGERIELQPTDLAHAAALGLLESSGVWTRDETPSAGARRPRDPHDLHRRDPPSEGDEAQLRGDHPLA